MSEMVTVKLYGFLGKEYGKSYRFAADSVAEVVRLLEANFPGFMARIREGAYYLVRGETLDGKPVREEALSLGGLSGTLHIVPAVRGRNRGKGLVTAILGTVIIGAAIVLSGGTLAAPIASLAALGGTGYATLAALGFGLVLQGVGMLLTPTPKASLNSSQDQKPGYLFTGPVNTVAQGGPVPLAIGKRVFAGSTVVSAGISSEAIMAPTTSAPPAASVLPATAEPATQTNELGFTGTERDPPDQGEG